MLQFDELMRPDDGTKSDQVLFYFSGFFLLLDELKALEDDAAVALAAWRPLCDASCTLSTFVAWGRYWCCRMD